MSQDDLFAKSRQALLSTDGGASQPANPTEASEQTRRSERFVPPKAKMKAKEAPYAADLVSPDSKRLRSEAPASSGGAAQPTASEPRLLPMPTEHIAGDADRWAAAWVTKAIGAELHRLQPFRFRRSEGKLDPGKMSHVRSWSHYLHRLESCVGAHTR